VALLKDRYGQPDKLVAAHLQALLDLPKPLNTFTSLQSFNDSIEKHISSLSTLGKQEESYGDLLVPVILNKLPPKTRKNMVREHNHNEWTLKDLREAIRNEVRVFEAETSITYTSQSSHPIAAFHSNTNKRINPPPRNSSTDQRTCARFSHSLSL